MTRYINDKGEVYNGRYVVAEGIKYISPSESKLAALGYHVVVDEPQVIEPTTDEQIWQLKEQLAAEDYKIIKCVEAQLTSRPMPYDYLALIEARDAIRNQINFLEDEK